MLSQAENTHSLTRSEPQTGRNRWWTNTWMCVCRLRLPKKHTEAGGPLGVTTVTKRRSHPVFGNNHWQRQAFPDSFGGFPQGVVPHNCTDYWPFVRRLFAKVTPITAYWTDHKLNTGVKVHKEGLSLPSRTLFDVCFKESIRGYNSYTDGATVLFYLTCQLCFYLGFGAKNCVFICSSTLFPCNLL